VRTVARASVPPRPKRSEPAPVWFLYALLNARMPSVRRDAPASDQPSEEAPPLASPLASRVPKVPARIERLPRGASERAAAGDDLHDPAHRVGAVDDARRAAHHLDALDVVDRQVCEVERPARRVHRHAVDEHLHEVAVAAAHEERRRRAPRAAGDDGEAWDGAQRVRQMRDAALAERLAGDHRDRRRRVAGGDGRGRRRDDAGAEHGRFAR
jgi:hypothetical protein